ncbi:MAG: DUF3109 family protein [Chitinophagaceae bacterium]|nr:DUF3109 family protein [Chitinophagaceae bacterium]
MIIIDNILVSDDVIEKKFVCDLDKCKGGCCEEGDAGAPLSDDELKTITEVFDKVKSYLTGDSVKEIGNKGKYVYHEEFGWVTPTIGSDQGICVYGIRDRNGIIKCAFEQAYNDGVIGWKKPVSCHLYPVTVKKGKPGEYDKVNYEPREILCSPACVLGNKLGIPAYKFVRDALIRKFGKEFYHALDVAAKLRQASEENEKIRNSL